MYGPADRLSTCDTTSRTDGRLIELFPRAAVRPAVIPIDPSIQPDRVRAAFHVTRRVWFGGGLRSRLAA
jgi:hypothetical protein